VFNNFATSGINTAVGYRHTNIMIRRRDNKTLYQRTDVFFADGTGSRWPSTSGSSSVHSIAVM
jgi:hypothetical protein